MWWKIENNNDLELYLAKLANRLLENEVDFDDYCTRVSKTIDIETNFLDEIENDKKIKIIVLKNEYLVIRIYINNKHYSPDMMNYEVCFPVAAQIVKLMLRYYHANNNIVDPIKIYL